MDSLISCGFLPHWSDDAWCAVRVSKMMDSKFFTMSYLLSVFILRLSYPKVFQLRSLADDAITQLQLQEEELMVRSGTSTNIYEFTKTLAAADAVLSDLRVIPTSVDTETILLNW